MLPHSFSSMHVCNRKRNHCRRGNGCSDVPEVPFFFTYIFLLLDKLQLCNFSTCQVKSWRLGISRWKKNHSNGGKGGFSSSPLKPIERNIFPMARGNFFFTCHSIQASVSQSDREKVWKEKYCPGKDTCVFQAICQAVSGCLLES